MPAISVHDLVKYFGDVKAVDHVDFTAEEGKFLTILGPSGCGKTTTLRCIAGLEKPDKGEIFFGDELVTSTSRNVHMPPEKRSIGMVFQSYGLWPHMTVWKNVGFPLIVRKFQKNQMKERIKRVLELLNISELKHRYPSQLSGGEQQRVALARSLVYEPEIFLLDEPLSNLDAKLRDSARFELIKLQRKLKITTIYVTHDQTEALVLSDVVCIMNKGKIEQMGSPHFIYENPINRFTADFIGKTNLLSGEVIECVRAHYYLVKHDELEIIGYSRNDDLKRRDKVLVSMRPQYITLTIGAKKFRNKSNIFCGRIEEKVFVGDYNYLQVLINGQTAIYVQTLPVVPLNVGDTVYIQVNPCHCIIIQEE